MFARSLLGAALLVVLGCSSPATTMQQGAPAQPPTITLLDAGAAARTELRLQPTKGDKFTTVLTMGFETSWSFGDEMPDVTLNRVLHIGFVTEVVDVTPDEIRWDLSVNSLSEDMRPGMSLKTFEERAGGLKTLEGLRISSVVDHRGFTRQREFKMPEAISPELRQTVESLEHSTSQGCGLFPEEPVGVGARWRIEESVLLDGVQVRQVTTYTLTSREGNMLGVAIELLQSAPEQDFVPQEMPSATARLKFLETRVEGNFRMSLDRLTPSVSSTTFTTTFQASSMDNGAMKSFGTTSKGKVDIESK